MTGKLIFDAASQRAIAPEKTRIRISSPSSRRADPNSFSRAYFLREMCVIAASAPTLLLASMAWADVAPPSTASKQLQEDYDRYAGEYDDLDGGPLASALGFPEQRHSLLANAHGDVLEVAVGTGLNLRHYDVPRLRSLVAADLSSGMLSQAQRKAAALGLSPPFIAFQQADVTSLAPFGDASFDSVVDTFSLCVFEDPAAALRSMRRVVRPGGQVLLLEHSRSPSPALGWYQDLTADTIARTGGKGCVWNQDVPRLVEQAGLRVERVEPHLGGLVLSIIASRPEV